MEKSNIVLIGMMGTFKSSCGKKAAINLKMDFIDTDDEIEKAVKMPIKEIFSVSGEEFFRKVEKRVVESASQMKNTVIACGGGVVLSEENMVALKASGKIFLLTADPEAIYNRVKNTDRPLLDQEDLLESIVSIQNKRIDLYKKHADFIIDNTHITSEETAEIVAKHLGKN